MDRYKSWNSIADSFYAADRIKRLVMTPLSESRSSSIMESNYSMIIEILRVLNDYIPGGRKRVISNAIAKGDLYSNTYRSFKNYINAKSDRKMNFDSITEALAILRPVLGNRHGITVDKILRIYEIVKS